MDFISNQLLKFELDPTLVQYLSIMIMILLITIICVIANFITKKVVIRIITRIVKSTKFKWDDILLERKVFHRLSHIVPAIILYYFSSTFPTYQQVIEKGVIAYLIIMGLIIINSLLNVVNDIYQTYEIAKTKPVKGYIQVVKIVVVLIGVILVIANLMIRVHLFC